MQNTQSRSALVEAHMKHVYSMAVRLYRQLARKVELGDLIAYGTEGLLEAADRFDPERGVGFATFTYYRIQGAMVDGVRKAAPMPPAVYQRELERLGRWEMRVPERRDPGNQRSVDDQVSTAELCGKLRRALGRLAPSERALLEEHYYGDNKLCDIGRSRGVSRSWASRLHARAIDSLRDELMAA